MRWFEKDKEEDALALLERGTQQFSDQLQEDDKNWRLLYASLKTDLLDEFLSPGKGHVKETHIAILKEQVRHVLSIAHVIGDKDMITRFKEEEKLIDEMRDLVQQYPDINVETSPDLRAALEKLRRMLREQQQLVFDHEEILQDEHRRLVDILEQVKHLKEDKLRSQHTISSFADKRENQQKPQVSWS